MHKIGRSVVGRPRKRSHRDGPELFLRRVDGSWLTSAKKGEHVSPAFNVRGARPSRTARRKLHGMTHCKKTAERAVSRILFRETVAGFRGGDHFSGPTVARRLKHPTRNSASRSVAPRRDVASIARDGLSREACGAWDPRESGRAVACSLLTWACWRWGLPCHVCHQTRGALLPHLFTLTFVEWASPTMPHHPRQRDAGERRPPYDGGVFSVALSLASLPVAVSHHRALSSSDFPPGGTSPRAAAWPTLLYALL